MLRKWIKALIIIIIVTVMLELTVFNFRFYESKFRNPIENFEVKYNGLIPLDENQYYVNESGEIYIEFTVRDKDINNIFLNIEKVSKQEFYSNSIHSSIYIKDEGNSLYYFCGDWYINTDIPESLYKAIHPAGNVYSIKVVFNGIYDQNIIINDFGLNVIRPILISVPRMIIIFLLLNLAYVLRPKSGFYSYKTDSRKRYQKIVMIVYIFVQSAAILFLSNQITNTSENAFTEQEQYWTPYSQLARSLAKGQTYLDIEPSLKLKELKNPYDPQLRIHNNTDFLWDYSYYGGKYYVYFGVVPAILFYLPYYLITGNSFHIEWNIYLLCIFSVIGMCLLLHTIVKRYFRNTPFVIYILMCAVFINGIGFMYCCLDLRFYSVPRLSALAFLIYGLYFWLSSLNDKVNQISTWRLSLGSLFIACIAGCRPQMLLIGLLAVPIYSQYFIKDSIKFGFSKDKIINIIGFLVPIFLVAFSLMYYNYLRFNNPIDFGANYNLTTNDMTRRGIVWDRTGLSLFCYLFQTPNVTAVFPFFKEVEFKTGYMGMTIWEPLYGGLFSVNIILLAVLFTNSVKDVLKYKKLYMMVWILMVSGLVIPIFDGQMAGILYGYTVDFAIFWFLAMLIIVLSLIEKFNNRENLDSIYSIIVLFCICSLVSNILLLFTYSGINSNTTLFQKISYMIQFWN